MPKKAEEAAIRQIQREYGVTAERARAIYFGHQQKLKRKGAASRLRERVAKLSRKK